MTAARSSSDSAWRSPIGALAYAVVFALLSIVTSRALIAGLVFVFIWEGAVTGIFQGMRYLSIRHYTLGLADWLSDVPRDYLDAYVGGMTALDPLRDRYRRRVSLREPAPATGGDTGSNLGGISASGINFPLVLSILL